MLKILWKRGEIAPVEQFLLLSTIFCYLMLDFYVKTGIRFSLRDKRLFEITGVEITRVDCIYIYIDKKSTNADESTFALHISNLKGDFTRILLLFIEFCFVLYRTLALTCRLYSKIIKTRKLRL